MQISWQIYRAGGLKKKNCSEINSWKKKIVKSRINLYRFDDKTRVNWFKLTKFWCGVISAKLSARCVSRKSDSKSYIYVWPGDLNEFITPNYFWEESLHANFRWARHLCIPRKLCERIDFFQDLSENSSLFFRYIFFRESPDVLCFLFTPCWYYPITFFLILISRINTFPV